MADVVPELNEAISRSFQSRMMRDRRVAKISNKIRDGTATLIDGKAYSEHLGENLSGALKSVLIEDRLPDGKLYYNIAKRTVIPALQNNYNIINEAVADIQAIVDEEGGIGLKAVKADFPESRINGLIDKMTADDITFDMVKVWLGEPIINNSEAFFDDYVRKNADFRSSIGMKTTITRIASPGCCEWCANLEGVYTYGEEPHDIYRRHEYCRCAVTFQSGKKSQSVWTKSSWESTPEELARRKDATANPLMTGEERAQAIAQIQQDTLIKSIMESTGYSRESARRLASKSPEQIAQAIEKAKKVKGIRR